MRGGCQRVAAAGYWGGDVRLVAEAVAEEPKPTSSGKMKKRLFISALICSCAIGCTTVETPNGARYRNFGFEKKFASLTYQGTNGVRFEIRGYTSEASAIAGAVAEGVAKGARPVP